MTQDEEIQVTLVMPYYRNPQMLALHYDFWAGLPAHVKRGFEVVLVDDGSPTEKAAEVPRPEGLPSLRIFEVLEDKLWHQHAARNIGAHEAAGATLILTDMDHMLTESVIEKAKYIRDEDGAKFVARVEYETGEVTLDRHGKPKPHPNTFIMGKNLFWKVGGYDEDFCGVYGTDGLFKERLRQITTLDRVKGSNVHMRRLTRDIVPDASTRDILRKEGRPKNFREKIKVWKRNMKRPAVVTLSMPYELVFPAPSSLPQMMQQGVES